MTPNIIGAALACFAFGGSLGFLFGACWHAHFHMLGEPDIDAEGDPQ